MTLRCEECRRRFGGQFVYDRHLSRREDRCRTPRELRLRGLVRRWGVWHQPRPTFQSRLPGLSRRGSREVEKGAPVSVAEEALSAAPDVTPQQPRTLACESCGGPSDGQVCDDCWAATLMKEHGWGRWPPGRGHGQGETA